MKVISFDGEAATLQIKALEIRTLRNALREALRTRGDISKCASADREVVEGLADTLNAVFDQVDPGELDVGAQARLR